METINQSVTVHLSGEPKVSIRINNTGNERYFVVSFRYDGCDTILFDLPLLVVLAIRDHYKITIEDCTEEQDSPYR